MTRRRSLGFTFVEAGVCVLIVSILAAIVFPNVIREQDSRSHRLLKNQIRAWVVESRNRAMETRTTVGLTYNKQTRTLEAIEEDGSGVSKPFPGIQLPEDVEPDNFIADNNESPTDGWRVPFFSDGSTTGGGIEFKTGEEFYSLIVDRSNGAPQVITGKLPDLSLQSWSAGGVQPRA